MAGITLEIFDFLGAAAGIVGENWSWLSPIVYGVAAALTVYYGAQLAANAISLVSKGIHTALAVAQMTHAAATGSLTIATAAGIAAQNGLEQGKHRVNQVKKQPGNRTHRIMEHICKEIHK